MIDERLKKQKHGLDILDKKTESYSDENKKKEISERIQIAHDNILKHRKLSADNLMQKGAYITQFEALEIKEEEFEVAMDEALKKEKNLASTNAKIKFSRKSLDVVKKVKEKIMTDVRKDMESKTMRYFDSLIWKKDTYKSVELNEDYKIKLIHKSGESCLGSCSAAERALLALSYTLSLHDISGQNSLLFIDTPVSRVSDENRDCFAKVISDISKERQIILAFTPSEYSKEIKEVFDSHAVSNLQLSTTDEANTTMEVR